MSCRLLCSAVIITHFCLSVSVIEAVSVTWSRYQTIVYSMLSKLTKYSAEHSEVKTGVKLKLLYFLRAGPVVHYFLSDVQLYYSVLHSDSW